MLKSLYALFVADLHRIYRLMPLRLRARMATVFGMMFILAILEVLSLLSLSFLGMSVGAPERVLASPPGRILLKMAPFSHEYFKDMRNVTLIASAAVVFLTLCKNGMSAVVGVSTSRLGEQISLETGQRILHQYLYTPYIEHLSGDSAAMFQAVGWRSHLGNMMINLMNVYTYGITSIALFFILVRATPGVILGTLAVVGSLAFILYRSIKTAIDLAGSTVARCGAEETKATLNAVNGIREVLIYRQQPVFFQKFSEAVFGGTNSRAFLSIAPNIPPWVLEVFGFAVIPVTLWSMMRLYDAPMSEISGVLLMIMLTSWRVLPLFNRSLSCVISARGMRPMAEYCLDRLQKANSSPIVAPPPSDPAYRLEDAITLENVSFRYPNATHDMLRDFSLRIPKGTQIGIIGPSGAGKSTLAGILSGLMQPTSGALKVDGGQLSPEGAAAYTAKVGYVPQAPYVMAGTVAENVAFSQWGKPWDEGKVKKACRMAALDIVETHEKGILIPLGERGTGLSGGQVQRVSIARVLYADPELLILDEATSALDQGTEAAIMDTINKLKGTITTVIIAHRLSTVAGCDEVVWVEEGKVVDQGAPNRILPEYEKRLREKPIA
ncbi:MAG: ABC transporter ATP-binding protein/permease [Desulfovibrio sp.]|jgi:ABC-type multidrug transport system fused ATPase/permease subunit|nr:ABC transporter ATP-binding protein/permease [Desulfovibrio sp.]